MPDDRGFGARLDWAVPGYQPKPPAARRSAGPPPSPPDQGTSGVRPTLGQTMDGCAHERARTAALARLRKIEAAARAYQRWFEVEHSGEKPRGPRLVALFAALDGLPGGEET